MLFHPFLFKPAPLHIPDGMLGLAVSIGCWLISAVILAIAVRKTRSLLGERQIPLMGVMAAFIFAAQMINFAVIGGTSGHLLGGALAAIALGPWAGMLVMAAVVIVQALLFQDGGLVVMGANILNMGIITTAAGYGIYRIFAYRSRRVHLFAYAAAAWISVMAAALATSLQLWLSGTVELGIVIPAMMGVHALIGTGEALVTAAALAFITSIRPDLIGAENQEGRGGKGWIAAGLSIALAVVLLTPLASADPDGLERVAINLGFDNLGAAAPYDILPDYTIPSLGETSTSTMLAGAAGVLLVAGLTIGVVRLIRRSPRSEEK